MRALAQRSADSAKEIKTLIHTSSLEVEEGVKLVAETGTSLGQIASKVAAINDVVGSIAANAQSQSLALREVNQAVIQMDKVTQQNAAMAEEATAASRSLATESSSLMSLLKQFQFSAAAPVQTGVPKDKLRWELKKAVPHVFRQNRPVPAGTSAKGEIKPLRAVVSGTTNSDDWQEF